MTNPFDQFIFAFNSVEPKPKSACLCPWALYELHTFHVHSRLIILNCTRDFALTYKTERKVQTLKVPVNTKLDTVSR